MTYAGSADPLDDICRESYQKGCFDHEPFAKCCTCKGAGDATADCKWIFAGPGGVQLKSNFALDLDNDNCYDACKLLKKVDEDKKPYADFCAGGAMEKDTHIAGCPAALESVQSQQRRIQDKWCTV